MSRCLLFGIAYTYNSRSFITSVKDSTGFEWFSIGENGYDARGLPVTYTYGDSGVSIQQNYDPYRQVLRKTTSTKGSSKLSNLSFYVDALGNFTKRTDNRASQTESFSYDALNRMTNVSGSGGNFSNTYDGHGNVLSRTDTGSYTYSRPHAVASYTNGGTTHSYGYDSNGNLTNRDGSVITWTAFNKPLSLKKGDSWTTFGYDANGNRVVQKSHEGDAPEGDINKKIYVGPFEQEWKSTDSGNSYAMKNTRIYIKTPAGEIGAFQHNPDGADLASSLERSFFHFDHLGSIVAVTDMLGAAKKRFSYDVWGNRRDTGSLSVVDANSLTPGGVTDTDTDRGFTGHEMLDGVGLVHMNARVYDPVLGRFFSPDSVVPYPDNLQSYNRYSYVRNNPLSYTDPSGHADEAVAGAVAGETGGEVGENAIKAGLVTDPSVDDRGNIPANANGKTIVSIFAATVIPIEYEEPEVAYKYLEDKKFEEAGLSDKWGITEKMKVNIRYYCGDKLVNPDHVIKGVAFKSNGDGSISMMGPITKVIIGASITVYLKESIQRKGKYNSVKDGKNTHMFDSVVKAENDHVEDQLAYYRNNFRKGCSGSVNPEIMLSEINTGIDQAYAKSHEWWDTTVRDYFRDQGTGLLLDSLGYHHIDTKTGCFYVDRPGQIEIDNERIQSYGGK
jgi:RHS repeat-associated protein